MHLIWLGTMKEIYPMKFLRQSLAKITPMSFYGDPYLWSGERNEKFKEEFNLEKILKENPDSDALIFDFNRGKTWKSWKYTDTKILKIAIIYDAIQDFQAFLPRLREWKFDIVCLTQGSKELTALYNALYPSIYYPLPFSIDPEVFKLKGYPERSLDCVLIGAITPEGYPLRTKICAYLNNEMKRRTMVSDRKVDIETYVDYLNKAKIFPFCSSIYRYVLAKYWEGMFCKTLVMADKPMEVPGTMLKSEYNYVEITEENFPGKIAYYLEHEDESKSIIENAYSYVLQNHTSDIRARQLVEIIQKGLDSR